ncbi:dihydrofolate reductase family protein [Actinoplanes sp. NPDC051633]|uniref:dihydrofolate reductase family protein n=1 Tax=Actinoplanes sp. NPDC051633 TaxID=3155670 RepID=UPI0034135E97
MRKLLVTAFLTLDGVHQAPGAPDEDKSGEFAYGGWAFPHWDDAISQRMDETMSRPFDLVLGRKTYDIFAGFWPNAPEEAGGKPLNDATKHVASRGKPTLEWQHSHLIEGDVPEGIAALKAQDGPELQVHGSANLVQTLMRHNLVDEYQLFIFPVLVGSGRRLFADGAVPSGLKLLKGEVTPKGALIANYAPDGELRTGSF